MDRWLGTALTAADGRRREIRVVDARPVAAGPILGSRGVSAVRRCRVVLRALSSSRSRIKIEQEYSKAGSPDVADTVVKRFFASEPRYLSRVMPTMSSGDGMRRCGGSCSSTAR